MTRRLLRYAANGLCLLSLLAAAATAWLWGHARPDEFDWVDVAAGPVLVRGGSWSAGVSLHVIRDWDSPPGVWARSNAVSPPAEDWGLVADEQTAPALREWRWGWWGGYTGTVRVVVGPDGRFKRVARSRAPELLVDGPPAVSPLLPEWGTDPVPHWQVLLATAAAPAAWAAGRGRRAWRRRARAGHCGGCGYDLRATPDPAGPRLPRCPECGAAALAAA